MKGHRNLATTFMRHLRRAVDAFEVWWISGLEPGSVRSRINGRILHLAMRGAGYGNWQNFERSGELQAVKDFAGCGGSAGLAIDVGAAQGDYSLMLLRETDLVVLAIEPNVRFQDDLLRIQASYPGRFHPVQCAVSNFVGDGSLFVSDLMPHLSTLKSESLQVDYVGEAVSREMPVSVMSLDELWRSHLIAPLQDLEIVWLKIDVEGSELEVLQGAKSILKGSPPKFIQVEQNVHQLVNGSSMYRLANALPGYQLVRLLPGASGVIECQPSDWLANVFDFANFIFIRDQNLTAKPTNSESE